MNTILSCILADAVASTMLQENQTLQITDRDNAYFKVVKKGDLVANGLDIIDTAAGVFCLQLEIGDTLSAYMFGFKETNTPIENFTLFKRMYACCKGRVMTIHTPDEDFYMEAAEPVVVGPNTTTIWGKGTLTAVVSAHNGEMPDCMEWVDDGNGGQKLQHTDERLDRNRWHYIRGMYERDWGSFRCYGAVFCTGDVENGYGYNSIHRFNHHGYPIDMGTIRWVGVKLRCPGADDPHHSVVTAGQYAFLHGISAGGGINIYENCTVTDMPNNGIVTRAFIEAHYINTRCNDCGLTGAGYARNGITNTGTGSHQYYVPEGHETRVLRVIGGEFRGNIDEGIHYSNVPYVYINGADCRGNGDRAIEGDNSSAYKGRLRKNDQIHVYNCQLEGKIEDKLKNRLEEIRMEKPEAERGVKKELAAYSMSFNGTYNKDVYLGGNVMGNCRYSALAGGCREEGSIIFTSKNIFNINADNFNPNLPTKYYHAIYVNAGYVDFSAGADFNCVGENADQSLREASLISINMGPDDKEHPSRYGTFGSAIVKNIRSNVKYTHGVMGRFSGSLTIDNLHCDTSANTVRAFLERDVDINISNVTGKADSTFLKLEPLSIKQVDGETKPRLYKIKNLDLRNNFVEASEAAYYPVSVIPYNGSINGSIKNMVSINNYWHGFTEEHGKRIVANNYAVVNLFESDLPEMA
ncbi:MAG: hypothetical protein OIF57_08860 [Marinobacterium sp.]|nr:hypothetical protein [Marinobacterium sp.]